MATSGLPVYLGANIIPNEESQSTAKVLNKNFISLPLLSIAIVQYDKISPKQLLDNHRGVFSREIK